MIFVLCGFSFCCTALKAKTDELKLEAHLKYPGAKTRYDSLVAFFVDKLLEE